MDGNLFGGDVRERLERGVSSSEIACGLAARRDPADLSDWTGKENVSGNLFVLSFKPGDDAADVRMLGSVGVKPARLDQLKACFVNRDRSVMDRPDERNAIHPGRQPWESM